MVVCRMHYNSPFLPLVRSLKAWKPIGKKQNYFEYDRTFLDFVKSELGDDPKTQIKVFSTNKLLDPESRHWCRVGGPDVETRH